MPAEEEHHLPEEIDARAEQTLFSATRHHVWEAGLIQLDTLEQVIQAGQEQIVVTQALRQVVTATSMGRWCRRGRPLTKWPPNVLGATYAGDS
ncbi:hypothetical protein [Deinococcus humi]|uniref:Uncharacterized protein n=1 Tax=Deinococcus humi TaxID=662880 RepID=A0A7W8JUP0_9DEIO|nr:hypothetical protein [Deinococcus humi]MBB5363607.1 hypothetical protein [Deinococcus humi]